MESAHLHNHHHHHHQQFQDPPPPSSSSPSSSYGGVSTSSTAHSWTPNTTLLSGGGGGGGLSSLYANGVAAGSFLSSRNHHQPMAQDLSFHHWANAAAAAGFAGGGGGSGQGIKQELSSAPDCYPPRLAADMQNTLDAKLLLGTLSGGGHQPAAAAGAGHQFYGSSAASSNSNANRGRFSQIYPTISVPSLNIEEASSLANSTSLGMNLQALDLFNSARINGAFVAHTSPDHQHLGFHNYGFDHHHLQQSSQRPFPSNVSSPLFSHATVAISADPKRPCNLVEPNPPQAPPKKSRLDSRASCPPFKVRKEKLGDRIAALQQLVAPFGKTDTASVLMEAIGYIKFLQNQVETLSVPYMKLSRNKSSGRAMQGVIKHGQEENIGSEEARRDLRSRGLCLVPLSCLSYVTDSGGGVWPPPSLEHFSPIQ
nr:transcription factor bHLH110-like isoform X3 [Ipomoea trifida]